MYDTMQLARAQGCWLGQLTGDALGSMVEFQGAARIAQQYPDGLREIGPSPVWNTLAGQPTDDSELALALARSLVARGTYDVEAVAAAYADWYDSCPFDMGHTTRKALSAAAAVHWQGASAATGARDAAQEKNALSEANGALMRQSPLAIWGYLHAPVTLAGFIRQDTALTHPNQVCQDASAAVIVPLAAVIREGLGAEAAYAHALAWDAAHGKSVTVSTTLKAARDTTPEYERNQGHVLIALQNAWYQVLHAPSFMAGVIATVAAGGDTDTNAAIAGALLGAIHGVEAVPVQWRDAVLTCRPSADIPGIRHPRPATYWPADALDLALALLNAA